MLNTVSCINYGGRKLVVTNLEGREVDVVNVVASWYDGPTKFNLFYVDFNGMFVDLIEDVVDPQRRIKTSMDDLVSLSFESDEVDLLLKQLVDVVNYSSRPLVSEDLKRKYAGTLKLIASEITGYRKKSGFDRSDLTIVPMKGGSYFLKYLEPGDVYRDTIAIECKRIPVAKRNSFCFGMRVDPSKVFLKNDLILKVGISSLVKKIRIIELCIVSGMTTIGFMLYLHANKIVPELIEVDTIAMSQQGYETITKFARKLGFTVRFVTGGLYYRLGNYYVSRRDELLTLDGKSVIGDVRRFLD